MISVGWIAMKATFAFPTLLLCAISYAIFSDEFFSKYMTLSFLLCICFMILCCIFIFNGMCAIKRKLYAEIRLFEELRDCDLEIEKKSKIKPFGHCNFNSIRQFFRNIYELCVFRPVYGILFTVGFVALSASCFILVGIRDSEDLVDLHYACRQLVMPSLFLMALVILVANSGVYATTSNCEFHSNRPFQEFNEMPMSVLFARTFAALVDGGHLHLFYMLLLCISVILLVNFLDYIKNSPEKDIEVTSDVPNIQLLLSALKVFSIVAGFFLLGHMILSAYAQAKRCTWAIIEKNWRRNLRAMEFLLPSGTILESLEDLEAALEVKREQVLTDNEKAAFDYIAMPLWQTRRPFVDMTQHRPVRYEDVPLSAEEVETVEMLLARWAYLNMPLSEQNRGSTEQRGGESSSVGAPRVTRGHSRQFSFGNRKPPAKITKRRQEIAEDRRSTIGESLTNYVPNYDFVKPEDDFMPSPPPPPPQEEPRGAQKPEPKRVTRRREYYD